MILWVGWTGLSLDGSSLLMTFGWAWSVAVIWAAYLYSHMTSVTR